MTSTYGNPSGAIAPTHLAVNWVVCHFGQFVNSLSLSFLLYEVEAKNMCITASLKGLNMMVTQSLCHHRMCSVSGQLFPALAVALVATAGLGTGIADTAGAEAAPHKYHKIRRQPERRGPQGGGMQMRDGSSPKEVASAQHSRVSKISMRTHEKDVSDPGSIMGQSTEAPA